jgi:excinuclease ABC subunit A
VIKTADWVVDIGPDGGSGGGWLVAEGTPEDVAGVAASHTGRFLGEVLRAPARARRAPAERRAKARASGADAG